MEQLKNHISLILTIITLVTALFTFDTRYAHSEDVKKTDQTTQTHIQETQKLVQQTTNNLRRSMIEDKVFELDVKQAQAKVQNPVDVAIKARYLRQLQEIPKDEPIKTP
jgi:flagellar biosynthesis protein FlhB